MPSARDYLIATLMGEANREGAVAQQGILDVIANRALAPSQYGSRSSSISDIVTARNGLEFNAWMPSDANYDRTTRALAGPGQMRGPEINQYQNAARVVDDFMANGIGRGSSQGATFYQTPGAPNQYQIRAFWGPNRDNYLAMGGHNFSGPGFVRDSAAYQAANPEYFNGQYKYAPLPGSDLFGDGFDASQGAGQVGPGSASTLGRPYETGDSYGFTGIDTSYGVGPGFNDLGSAVPYGDVDPLAFGAGRNVGGGEPGSFGGFAGTMQTGNGFGFTGLNTGGGTGPGMFGPTPRGFDGAAYLAANQDVAAAGMNPWEHYTRWGQTENRALNLAGDHFNGNAYLAANPDVARAGMDPFQHFQKWGAEEGRTLAPTGWAQPQGPGSTASALGPTDVGAGSFPGQTVTAQLPDGGVAATAPGLTPAIGPTFASAIPPGFGRTDGPPSSTPAIGPTMTSALPPNFSPVDYIAANGDLAGMSNQQAIDHFLANGQFENRALAPWLPQQVYAAAPPAASPAINTATTATAQGPTFTPAIGPTDVPAIGPQDTPALGPTTTVRDQGPGQIFRAFDGGEYLKANADVAAAGQDPLQHYLRYGMAEGRALDTAGHHLNQNFDGTAYLAQNQDVARAGMDPLQHYLTSGAAEGRNYTTGPTAYQFSGANVGAGAGAQATGFSGLTPLTSPAPAQPVGPLDFGGANVSGGVGPGSFMPAGFQPSGPAFSGAGIGNGFGFTGLNAGSGLGATAQSFGSYPPTENIPTSSGGSPGGGIDPLGFTNADVSGFDVNAAAPPADAGGQGGGGGGGGGGTAKGSSSSAAFLADQAKTRAYWDSLVKPAELYGNTNTATTPVITPTVPNLTVSNLAMGAPGAMFSAFAPWR